MKTVLIGASCDLGVHVNGASKGPNILIDSIDKNVEKIILKQDDNIIKSTDKNDLRKNEKELNNYNEKLYNLENKYLNDNYFVITIGGDHSVAIPTVLSDCNKNENIGLIWVDAHPDYNTFETTITGNLHGLPCACVSGYKCIDLRRFHKTNTVNPKNVVILGARSIDKLELENLKEANVTIITTDEIKEKGSLYCTKKAIDIASKNTNKIHISFDTDVIDPLIAPGVSIPEVDGITKEDAYTIMDEILKNISKINSIDVVEYNPLKDKNNITKDIDINVINKIINKALDK